MKLAFDAKRAFNNSTGLGNYARILLNDLMRYYPDNDYLLCSPGISEELFHELNGNFKLILPETKFQKSFLSLWRSYGLTQQLHQDGVDLYHGLSNELPFNIHRSGIKSVVTVHDVIFLKHTEQYPFIDRQFYQLKTEYAVKHANKIIAVSQETKNDLVEFYQVPEGKIEVIYQAVDERFLRTETPKQKSEIQAKYGLPEKFILNVGSFFPRKNQKTLVEAFSLIQNKVEESLVLIGSAGSTKREIEQLIDGKNLQGRVKIIISVPNEDLPIIYRAANAFVFPSLYEGFGIPVLEALYSEVPVVTTKGGAMEEAGGVSSLYINPWSAEEMADALLRVLNDTALRAKMIEHGLSHARSMSGKISAEKTMTVYSRL